MEELGFTVHFSYQEAVMALLLECVVAKGMHDSEYAIKFTSAEGVDVSAFVPRAKVKLKAPLASNQEVPGAVIVQLLDSNAEAGLVQLPAQVVNGSDIVKVSKHLLATQ